MAQLERRAGERRVSSISLAEVEEEEGLMTWWPADALTSIDRTRPEQQLLSLSSSHYYLFRCRAHCVEVHLVWSLAKLSVLSVRSGQIRQSLALRPERPKRQWQWKCRRHELRADPGNAPGLLLLKLLLLPLLLLLPKCWSPKCGCRLFALLALIRWRWAPRVAAAAVDFCFHWQVWKGKCWSEDVVIAAASSFPSDDARIFPHSVCVFCAGVVIADFFSVSSF